MFFLNQPYFLIIQGLILILFFLIRNINKESKYFLFKSKLGYIITLVCAIVVGVLFNRDRQLFCIPVDWALFFLIGYSVFMICSLVFAKLLSNSLGQAILGIGLFISPYIIGFGSSDYLIWMVFQLIFVVPLYFLSRFLNKKYQTQFFDSLNFYGVAILLPYILLGWIIWQAWSINKKGKHFIFISPILILLISISLSLRMGNLIEKINTSANKEATAKQLTENKIDSYLIELVLGAHWKYHTRICLYDGWRPPFHDPILGFAQSILYLGKHFNDELNLQERNELYKKVFPDKKTNFDCKCAKKEWI